MKIVALLTLVGILGLSVFHFFGAELTNNSVAVALMIVLLAVIADLKEFNFWGLSGKKKEEDIKKLKGESFINEESKLQPSPYKIRKALKEDVPDQMDSLANNFLAVSFEIERQLRVIARSIARSTEETAKLDPESVLNFLEDEELLTPEACEAIESIREIRTLLTTNKANTVSTALLETGFKLSQDIFAQLKAWLDGNTPAKT